MNKLIVPFLLTLVLTACGGGGGGGTATVADVKLGSVTSQSAIYSLATGHFTANETHVVMAGWESSGSNTSIPLKIYRINADGTGADVTAAILGSEVTASVNYPLIADFNNDGIDDLFLAGFHDFPVNNYTTAVYLSRPGSTHQYISLQGFTWNHGIHVADINNNGTLDVVNSLGQMWLNDGAGNFTFRDHNYNINNPNNLWMHGSGVCAGDFNNTGRNQIVITDLSLDGLAAPIADTVIFELDTNLNSTVSHTLPVPILDRNSTTVELSHDVACRAVDINNDGKLDIVVYSRPNLNARPTWTNESVVQVLINQGNWQFTDISDTAVPNIPAKVNPTSISVKVGNVQRLVYTTQESSIFTTFISH